MATTIVDLTTLSLPTGHHTITVRAKASGHIDSDFSDPVVYDVYTQLASPVATLSDNIVSVSPVPHANAFEIYANNALEMTQLFSQGTSVDLDTLSLPAGTYEIKVRCIDDAVGSYYTPSDFVIAGFYVVPVKLGTPICSIADNMLSWNSVTDAVFYTLYIDGVAVNSELIGDSFNLLAVSLELGDYSIQLQTNGYGSYRSSDLSEPILYTKHLSVPSKSTRIVMDIDGTDREYRVVKVNNSIIEVLGLFTPGSSIEFSSSGRTYSGSTLDNYLNKTWYGTLNESAKNAIVDKTFRQDSWHSNSSGNPDYSGYYGSSSPGTNSYTISLGSTTFGSSITRHVYALSVQDVLDYVLDTNITDGQLQNYNIWNMFLKTPVMSGAKWLRSANAETQSSDPKYSAFGVTLSDGRPASYSATSSLGVRPAFQIDLSKIGYRISTLTTPVATLSDDTISWTGDLDALSYTLYIDGVPAQTGLTDRSFDLSSLALPLGVYNIQVQAISSVKYPSSNLSEAVEYRSVQLEPPIITSFNDNNVTFYSSNNAEWYDILIDTVSIGTYTPSISRNTQITVDITTLGGWGDTHVGNHALQVVAKGELYRDSEPSNGVNVGIPVGGSYVMFSGTDSFTLTSTLISSAAPWNGIVEYSLDTETWTVWDGARLNISTEPYVLYLRGYGNTHISQSSMNQLSGCLIVSTSAGTVRCDGNIENLLDYRLVEQGQHPQMDDYCYYLLFGGMSYHNLESAPDFIAPNIAQYCYSMVLSSQSHIRSLNIKSEGIISEYAFYRAFDSMSGLLAGELDLTNVHTVKQRAFERMTTNYCPTVVLGTNLTTLESQDYDISYNQSGTNAKMSFRYEFTDEDEVLFDTSNIIPSDTGTGSKGSAAYKIYTDNTIIKNAALAKVGEKVTVEVYHLDGSVWDDQIA